MGFRVKQTDKANCTRAQPVQPKWDWIAPSAQRDLAMLKTGRLPSIRPHRSTLNGFAPARSSGPFAGRMAWE
jgi:hypothetical protein